MSKKIMLEPTLCGPNVVVQFTDNVTLDKTVFVRVPNDYSAFLNIEERFVARMNPCAETNLLAYLGKAEKGKSVQLAFARKGEIPSAAWGFGNIAVPFNGGSYNVGANGRYEVEIVEPMKFVKAFGSDQHILADTLVAKTKPLLVAVAKDALVEMFSTGQINPHEAATHANEFEKRIQAMIQKKDPFAALGASVKSCTVVTIHVPEAEAVEKPDVASVQEQVSSALASFKADLLQLAQEGRVDADIRAEMVQLREEVAMLSEKQDLDSVLDEIDNLRQELHEAIDESAQDPTDLEPVMAQLEALRKQMEEMKKRGNADVLPQVKTLIDEMGRTLERKIDARLAEAQETIIKAAFDKDQDTLPLYETAEKDFLANLKITTDLLLEKAENEADYATIASMIYSDVEENFINKFNVPHREEKFYMTSAEYINLKPTYLSSWHNPRTIRFRGETEEYVEMPVEIRFAKAGFSVSESRTAAANWSALNMMRHRSPENKARLASFLRDYGSDAKGFLTDVLRTFRQKGVYTRD